MVILIRSRSLNSPSVCTMVKKSFLKQLAKPTRFILFLFYFISFAKKNKQVERNNRSARDEGVGVTSQYPRELRHQNDEIIT